MTYTLIKAVKLTLEVLCMTIYTSTTACTFTQHNIDNEENVPKLMFPRFTYSTLQEHDKVLKSLIVRSNIIVSTKLC